MDAGSDNSGPPEQTRGECKKAQLKRAMKYKQELAICKKREAMTRPNGDGVEQMTLGLLSSDDSDDAPMVVSYSITGEAAGAVIGIGRTTL